MDGPPSELQARREKYAFFEKHCSEVADGIFLGSDVVARNRETLRAAKITHVINCVGFLYPAYFKDELTYLVLYLQGKNHCYLGRKSLPLSSVEVMFFAYKITYTSIITLVNYGPCCCRYARRRHHLCVIQRL
jgi:hypothetical protein